MLCLWERSRADDSSKFLSEGRCNSLVYRRFQKICSVALPLRGMCRAARYHSSDGAEAWGGILSAQFLPLGKQGHWPVPGGLRMRGGESELETNATRCEDTVFLLYVVIGDVFLLS